MSATAADESSVRPAGSCKHRPISNGWSAGWSRDRGLLPSVSWCGYCKAVVEHDAEWLAKFAAAGRPVTRHDPASP